MIYLCLNWWTRKNNENVSKNIQDIYIIDKEYKGISRRINIEKIKYLDKDLLKLYHL